MRSFYFIFVESVPVFVERAANAVEKINRPTDEKSRTEEEDRQGDIDVFIVVFSGEIESF